MKNDHEDDDNDDCDYDENDDEVVILKEWGWENVAATKLSVKYQNIGRLRFAIAEKIVVYFNRQITFVFCQRISSIYKHIATIALANPFFLSCV